MDRQLIQISPDELEALAVIHDDGSLTISSSVLAGIISRATAYVGIRVAIVSADYYQQADGAPEPATRSMTGMWWLSHGDDTAVVGSVSVDGVTVTIVSEGETEAPVAEDLALLERATKAIASEYPEAKVLEPGKAEVQSPSGGKLVRVVVTRDHRVRRPQDLLDPEEVAAFNDNTLALAIVQVIGGDKALVIKHGL